MAVSTFNTRRVSPVFADSFDPQAEPLSVWVDRVGLKAHVKEVGSRATCRSSSPWLGRRVVTDLLYGKCKVGAFEEDVTRHTWHLSACHCSPEY